MQQEKVSRLVGAEFIAYRWGLDWGFFVTVLEVNEFLLHFWPALELDIVDLLPCIKPFGFESHIVAGANISELFWRLNIFGICLA
jgi:hypothetical protein